MSAGSLWPSSLRATLDEGPRSIVQWNGAILLKESHNKLDPWPLDKGPKPKKWQIEANLHGTILEGKSIGSKLKPPQNKAIKGSS
jgi:hypothetical protein